MSARGAECENFVRRHLDNPFFVLELPTDATREESERQGEKLLAMLAAGLKGADRFETPFGPRPRTPEGVRAALAELRNPDKRLAHEFWARGLRK